MKKTRRNKVRIISYLTALILVLAIFGAVNAVAAEKAKLQLRASRERALTELGTSLDTISTNLDKSVYVSTEPMIADIAGNIRRASTFAKTNLAEITDGNIEISSVYKFLSQVGEYSLYLSKKIGAGEKLTNEETEMLTRLKEYSGKLSAEVNYLIDEEQSGGLDFEEVKSTLSDSTHSLYYGNEIEDASEVLQDYPTLIYDGPFSDRQETEKSELISSLEAVTENEAKEKAAAFLDVDEGTLYPLSECESNLPCYTFYNTDYTISVTKNGGIVSYLLSQDYAGESVIDYSEAVKKATEFLTSKGYKNIKESYYFTSDGICTVNFSYYENGITYYTDLIKVGVALDTGKIMSFDSTGFLMNHKKRSLPQNTAYTIKSAEKILHDGLTVKSSKKCFIPTDFGTELYTYEYHCVAEDKTEILVYIDPITGNEANLLILLYADGGVLTE